MTNNNRSSTHTQGSGRMLRAKNVRFVSLRDENIRLRAQLAIARHQAALWKQAAKGWRQTALEYLGSVEPVRVPLVGTLSKDTRPEDFAQYAANTQHVVRNTE